MSSLLRISVAILNLALFISGRSFADDGIPVRAVFHSSLIDDGNDLIFPSVVKAADHFREPLATWYLYTSPHSGADIRLYTAEELTGPWKLHGTVVGSKVGKADHVSSPHAIWNETERCLFLYVHAPNSQTIYCRSKDGIHFDYGGVCVTSEMLSRVVGFESRAASYARVYEHRIPEFGNRYVMTITASGSATADGTKQNAIVLCTSDDGVHWTARRKLLDDNDGGRTHKSLDAALLPVDGRVLLVYAKRSRADEGKLEGYDPVRLHVAEGDVNWRQWKELGVFYDPSDQSPDDLCARGPLFVDDGEQQWMLYEAGPKKSGSLALLTLEPAATPTTVSLDDVLDGRTLTLKYETSFDEPLKMTSEANLTRDGFYVSGVDEDVDWILEGPGGVRVEDGSLHMECADGHTVLWNRREFPSDFVAEWHFTHRHKQGLAILFFAANGVPEGPIHQEGLPARDGVFRNYTKGSISCYHTSYFAINKDGQHRGETHFRKNPGSNLVAEGACRLDGTNQGPHRIRVAKLGPRILLEVNGVVSMDWTDQDAAEVPPLTTGQIGLRQMQHTIEASYEFFRVYGIE